MVAIILSDCTVDVLQVSGVKIVKIITPATADDGDTIDVSSLFTNGCFTICSGVSDNAALGATGYGKTITVPGSADNEARTIIAIGE